MRIAIVAGGYFFGVSGLVEKCAMGFILLWIKTVTTYIS